MQKRFECFETIVKRARESSPVQLPEKAMKPQAALEDLLLEHQK